MEVSGRGLARVPRRACFGVRVWFSQWHGLAVIAAAFRFPFFVPSPFFIISNCHLNHPPVVLPSVFIAGSHHHYTNMLAWRAGRERVVFLFFHHQSRRTHFAYASLPCQELWTFGVSCSLQRVPFLAMGGYGCTLASHVLGYRV